MIARYISLFSSQLATGWFLWYGEQVSCPSGQVVAYKASHTGSIPVETSKSPLWKVTENLPSARKLQE